MQQFQTREEWLVAAVAELRPQFDYFAAAPAAQRIRVACGFPASWKRSKALGECWIDKASSDGTHEILIAPTIENAREVLAVLIHELIHTTPGSFNHGKTFQKSADALGLIPCAARGYKATSPGPQFDSMYGAILAGLGPYPHAALNASTRKTQGTRLLKAFCPSCGYTIRLTAKWANQGLPTCVCGSDFSL